MAYGVPGPGMRSEPYLQPYKAALAMQDPLTHCARPRIEPASWHCRDAADSIVPQGNSLTSTVMYLCFSGFLPGRKKLHISKVFFIFLLYLYFCFLYFLILFFFSFFPVSFSLSPHSLLYVPWCAFYNCCFLFSSL